MLSPDISQVATCLSRKNQITSVCILLTKQPASSRQLPNYTSSRQEPICSLHSPDRSQVTACVLQREAKSQPASFRQQPSHRLHSPDRSQVTACTLQTGAKSQPAFSKQEPSHSLHSPNRSQVTACILQTGVTVCIYPLHKSQITVWIILTLYSVSSKQNVGQNLGTNYTSSRQEPNHSKHALNMQEPNYNPLKPSDSFIRHESQTAIP